MSHRDPRYGDDPPRLASYWEPLSDGRVRCTLCPQTCRIRDGSLGACGVRVNRRGSLHTLVYDRVVVRQVDPIEKKPLYHFLPGSLTYSIAAVGCPLKCAFCQNWEISQWPKQHLPRHVEWEPIEEPFGVCPELGRLHDAIPGARVAPEEMVEAALTSGAASIAYTYAEPTVFYELVRDTAALAREAGLKNVMVTSGYIREAPLREIAPLLDGANVDLKFFHEESYRRVSRGRRDPVLEAIRRFHELGVWTEVTTLVIPGLNDSDEELRRIAGFIRSVGPGVPWHVTRFHPSFEMWDRPPTPPETLRRARAIGLEAGLRFVYLGNAPGEGGEDTSCPACGATLLRRTSLVLRANRVRGGRCPDCGTPVDGIGLDPAEEAPPVAARGGID